MSVLLGSPASASSLELSIHSESWLTGGLVVFVVEPDLGFLELVVIMQHWLLIITLETLREGYKLFYHLVCSACTDTPISRRHIALCDDGTRSRPQVLVESVLA